MSIISSYQFYVKRKHYKEAEAEFNQLVKKYRWKQKKKQKNYLIKCYYNDGDKYHHCSHYVAKNCTLIAVDEILNVVWYVPPWYLLGRSVRTESKSKKKCIVSI